MSYRWFRRPATMFTAALLPQSAFAHDAFGDLGPFYANLLHPIVDPAQGLLIVAGGVLLARQPLSIVRPAYTVLAAAGALAVVAEALTGPHALGLRVSGTVVALIGLLALIGARLPALIVMALAAAVGVLGALAPDPMEGTRAAVLGAFGGAAGIALFALLIWGGVDMVMRRLGPVAGAVAASWVAAIGVMAAAMPG